MIELRRQLYPERHDYEMIATSVTDLPWLDGIPADRLVIVVAEGLVEYRREQDAVALFSRLTEQFASGHPGRWPRRRQRRHEPVASAVLAVDTTVIDGTLSAGRDGWVGKRWRRRASLGRFELHMIAGQATNAMAIRGAGELQRRRLDAGIRTSHGKGWRTQNQALAAPLFLCRHMLREALPWLEELVRAKRPRRLPVVMTREEVAAVLSAIGCGAGAAPPGCSRRRRLGRATGCAGGEVPGMRPGVAVAVGVCRDPYLRACGDRPPPAPSPVRNRCTEGGSRCGDRIRLVEACHVSHVSPLLRDAPPGGRIRHPYHSGTPAA